MEGWVDPATGPEKNLADTRNQTGDLLKKCPSLEQLDYGGSGFFKSLLLLSFVQLSLKGIILIGPFGGAELKFLSNILSGARSGGLFVERSAPLRSGKNAPLRSASLGITLIFGP